MKKTPVKKSRRVAELAPEYCFNYSKAKPNRFANVHVEWTAEKFVEEEKKEGKRKEAKAKAPAKAKKAAAKKVVKAKAAKKKPSSKGKKKK